MTWKTPPEVEGDIDIAAAVQRANGKHPAPPRNRTETTETAPQPLPFPPRNRTPFMENHMTFPTRPAIDADLFFEFDGKPAMVSTTFYGKFADCHYHTNGFRRPRKIGGKWVVSRYGNKPLMVRTDRNEKPYPNFVALTWGPAQ